MFIYAWNRKCSDGLEGSRSSVVKEKLLSSKWDICKSIWIRASAKWYKWKWSTKLVFRRHGGVYLGVKWRLWRWKFTESQPQKLHVCFFYCEMSENQLTFSQYGQSILCMSFHLCIVQGFFWLHGHCTLWRLLTWVLP